MSIAYELLAKLLCQLVCVTFDASQASCDLHNREEKCIKVHSSKVTEDNVVIHDQSILANPVLRRIEVTGI